MKTDVWSKLQASRASSVGNGTFVDETKSDKDGAKPMAVSQSLLHIEICPRHSTSGHVRTTDTTTLQVS